MAKLKISPDGEIAVGTFRDDDGELFCLLPLTDVDGVDSVELYFRLPHFVAFADHLRSVADELLTGRV